MRKTRNEGCIFERPKGSGRWVIKYEAPRGADGKRNTRWKTIHGSKKDAQRELRALLHSIDEHKYVEPSKLTVGEHVRKRVHEWRNSGTITQRTFERYLELTDCHIAPHLGHKPIQELRSLHIAEWHATLRTSGRRDGKGGLSARTIGHAHRVLSKALRDAMKYDQVFRNVAATQGVPKVSDKDRAILTAEQVRDVVEGLKGQVAYPFVATALFTGLRLSELLALPWSGLALEAGTLQVATALDKTKGAIGFKIPKTKAGVRKIRLPAIVIEALRDHRRQQLETRLALGVGKLPDDALVFSNFDGGPRSPHVASKEWSRLAKSLGIPEVTFHGLRHTHVSQLVEAGVDIVTISKRIGHANPATTLRTYAHMFKTSDEKAANAINSAFSMTTLVP